MAEFAVCVTFRLRPEAIDAFIALVAEQARASLTEPGCEVFDVWQDAARREEVFLYEIYTGAAAFDTHLRTAHFRSFDRAIRDMISEKKVVTWAHRGGLDA